MAISRDIDKTKKICWNCEYFAWMVGIGQGIRCTNDKNRSGRKMAIVPGRYHSCDYFCVKDVLDEVGKD